LLEIDGSYGEGGGQILRTAVALSVLTKKPVKIKNIRANRPAPGIKPQHYIAIQSVKELCNADVEGLEIGSSNLVFTPGNIKGGRYKFDIGTAGSITMVFQACLLSALKTSEPITMVVTGGTDVKWSPSWDYFRRVFLPLIQKSGVSADARLIRRGYYPKGGGEAELTIEPFKDIKPLQLDEQQEYSQVKGIIHLANLPNHVGTRMKHASIKSLIKHGLKASIEVEETTSLSTGTGITLWVESKDTVLGSTVLGEKGVPAEKIGEDAAQNLLCEIDAGATMDVYAFDQILPYMALAQDKGASSCIVREVSSHARTNMWLVNQFFDTEFKLNQSDDNVVVAIS
jgi:RNA 3'-phosphate cyclase